MTNIEWFLEKVPNPSDSSDYADFYDEFCINQGHVSVDTYKRYTRKCVQEYREHLNTESIIEKDIKDKEVLLDKLNETDSKLELSLKSYKIQDVETAAKIAGIDLSEWKCVSKTVRASQNNGNPWYIVEGKFKPRDINEITPEEMLENYKTILQNHKVPISTIDPPIYKDKDNIALFNFYDHHIGKKIQADVTGNKKDWTVPLAKESMLSATDYFISKVKDEVHKVWFILGNDLLNVDNPEGTTTKGTPQKNDVDYKHLILESEELLITILEKLLNYFTVDVIVIPGNHDTNFVFLLGEILRHYFTNNKNIEIDNSLPLIKYKKFGETAFGFVHGSEQIKKKYVLPMMMMQQRPDLVTCRYKEFHTGHTHQTKSTQITEVMEDYGVLLRTLPTLSPVCEWANNKGFMGKQATECIVYNRDFGPIATYRYGE